MRDVQISANLPPASANLRQLSANLRHTSANLGKLSAKTRYYECIEYLLWLGTKKLKF